MWPYMHMPGKITFLIEYILRGPVKINTCNIMLVNTCQFVCFQDKLHFLKQNGVVYINMDTSVTGTQLLAVTASPSLNSLVHETLQKVSH